MNTAIITARMSSKRVPGKVMKDILGKPVIGRIIDRINASQTCDDIIVATTKDPSENDLIEYCSKRGCHIVRGSTEDVLGRFYQASRIAKHEKILRLTADLPFLSTESIDDMDKALVNTVDYVNSCDHPIPYLDGTSAEMLWRDTVERLHRVAEGHWRQHVTVYARYDHHCFNRAYVEGPDIRDIWHVPMLLDEPEHLELTRYVQGKLNEKKGEEMDYLALIDVIRENLQDCERFFL